MPVQFVVRVLDIVVSVELDDSLPTPLSAAIVAQWAHLTVDPVDRTPVLRWRLTLSDAESQYAGDDVVVVAATQEAAADQLATRLTLAGLRNLAGRTFLFHAAGLALDDGLVLAFVGPSGRGKTTLARHLGMTLGYVTDETVAFRHDLSVIPYPKPLSIGSRPGAKRLHSPLDLGLRLPPNELRLGALILLDRDPAVTEPRVEEVPLVEALGELVPQMSSLSRMPHPLRSLVDVISATGGVRRLVYGGAEDLRELVPTILRATAATPTVSNPTVGEVPSELAPGAVGRAPYVDALSIGDDLAVLGAHRLHVLAGIGPAVWRSSDGIGIEQLRGRIESVYGPSPDGIGSWHVAQATDRLVAAGVLRSG
jgi:hypothetical protein